MRWNTGGHMSLGFGSSMNGMDVISAEFINNAIVINDRWSDSSTTPSLDSEIGGKNDLTLINFINSDSQGYTVVKFNRAINTGDQYDYVIAQQKVTFCYAYSDQPTISYHGSNIQIFTFEFIEKSDLIKAHANSMELLG